MSFLNRASRSRRSLQLSRLARRRMILESLEGRMLLAGDGAQVIPVNENQSFVFDVNDVGTIVSGLPGSVYSISGGADAALFAIDETTGVLSFLAPPDFENPDDANVDNVYDVQVSLTDAGNSTQTIDLCPQVMDVSGLALNYQIQDLDPNDYTLVRNGESIEIREAVSGNVVSSSAANDTSLVQITGSANANRLVVDFAGGPLAGVIEFDGGGPTSDPGDSLELVGGSADTIVHVLSDASSGDIEIAFADAFGSVTVTYTGLEPIIDNLSAVDRVFSFEGGAETITLADDAVVGDGFVTIDSNLSESVTFASPSHSLRINSGSGTDIINVNSLDSLFAASLIIDGGTGSDDSLQMTDVSLINTPGRGLRLLEIEVVTVTGGTISGNSAVIGGGVLVENSTSGTTTNATFSGVTISGNTATGDAATEGGGGLYNDGANLVISGASLVNLNRATGVAGSGGGIFSSGGSLVLSAGAVIEENSANRAGGGIELLDSPASLTGVILRGNDANGGAGTANPGNGGGLHVSGSAALTTTLLNVIVQDNIAANEGGGLWNQFGFTMNLGAVQVIGNVANAESGLVTNGGGGVFNNGGTVTIDDGMNGPSIFRSNRALGALGNGGAIMTVGGSVTMSGGTIEFNAANRAGGGIENNGGTVSLTNVALGSATPGDGNRALINGGGLHTSGSGIVDVFGGIVQNNVAGQEGGGLWNSPGGTLRIQASGMGGTLIDSNIASGMETNMQGGGGVFNEGDGLGVGGTVTINDATISTNSAAGDGPGEGGGGVFNLGVLTIVDTDITGNLANVGALGNGGGVFNAPGGVTTITGGIIAANIANRAGGGIENNAGDVTLTNVTLGGPLVADGNVAGINGGGLHTSGAGTVTIMDAVVQNNVAGEEGGGLWNSAAGTLTVLFATTETLIQSNTASGDATEQGGGGVFNDGGVVNITGATISQNVSSATAIGNGGGGIFNDGTLTLTDTHVLGNAADQGSANGGGILNSDGGVLTINNGVIASNSAARAGGGIENNAGTVTLNAVIVGGALTSDGNTAGINGGGLHVSGTGTTNVNGGLFQNNLAAQEGGGLWNASGTMTIDGTTITENVASGAGSDQGGGGVFNAGGTVKIDNAIISINKADGLAGSGGGIFNDANGMVTVANSQVNGNVANRAGGGIEATAGTTTSLDTVTLSSNVAGATSALATPGNGGGLHITGNGNATITDGTVSMNTAAEEGGGIWNGTGIMTIDGTTVTANTASGDGADQGGGGIFNAGGTVNVSNAFITLNTANGLAGSGGGVLNDAGGSVTFTDTEISGNIANRAGGGIEATAGTSTSLNAVTLVSNNVGVAPAVASPGNGGGLHITGDGNATITLGTVTSNTAAAEGGGLWNGTGTMTIDGTNITSNTASGAGPDQGGGGVFNAGGAVNISNATISLNTADGAAGSGGGILNDASGSITVTGTLISDNVANRAGGGIEVTGATTTTLTDVQIIGNNAGVVPSVAAPGNGGGVHITGAGSVVINGGSVNFNVAAAEGGGLWNSFTGTLIVQSSLLGATTILSNTANGDDIEQGGGGVFNDGGSILITDATISLNVSTATAIGNGGGGIFNDGALTLTNVNITDNFADQGVANGGGILNSDGGLLVVVDSIIENNEAARAGGGIENNAGTVTLTNTSLSTNMAGFNGGALHTSGAGSVTISGGLIDGNTAGEEGGGLWNSSAGTMSIQSSSVGGTTIQGNTANGNGTEQGGGGVFNDGGVITIQHATISLNVSTATAIGNGGGGIFNDGTMTLVNTLVNGNTAIAGAGNGGGILNSDNGTLAVSGGKISGNRAARAGGGVENVLGIVTLTNVSLGGLLATDSNTAGINGGGLHTSGAGTVTIRGGVVQNNTAGQEGGGVWNSSTGTMEILTSASGGTLIRGNVANGDGTEQGGGGVFNDGGDVTIDGAAINQNVSTAASVGNGGGGIFNDGNLSISNSSVIGNSASTGLGNGGGILNSDGGVLVITTSRIASNVAARAGGGIENIAGSLVMTDTVLGGPSLGDGNIANINGGGLHVSGAGTVSIFGGMIEGNTAGQEGGGVWNSLTGTMTIAESLASNTVIRNNVANGNGILQGGGGVFNDGGSLAITNAAITGNVATSAVAGNGGGGVMSVGGSLRLRQVEVSGNTANFGAGVNNMGVVTIVASTIANNSANAEGGGLYNGASGSATVNASTIAGNVAVTGAGIRNVNTTALTSTLVAGNVNASTTADDNLSGTFSGSHNLIGQAVADFGTNNIVGVDWRTVVENDGTNVTLKNNGGMTQTIALRSNSPAIDAGVSVLSAPSVDQRGVNRTIDLSSIPNATGGDGTDIGAVETVGISISDSVANEGDVTLSFVITLSDPIALGATVTVQLDTSDMTAVAGLDYNAITAQTVTFVGGGALTQTVFVTLRDDILVEAAETFTATLSNASGSAISDASATGTITENDLAGFTLNKTTASVSEAGTIDTFTVVLNAQPMSDVVITISSDDTSEVTIGASSVSTSTLTFTSANWNQPQGVAIVGADDSSIDGDQSTAITVSIDAASSDALFGSVADQIVTATTTDNEVAGFTVTLTAPTVSENGSTTTFTVVLAAQPLSNVLLNVASANVAEVTVDLTALTFTALNWNQPQTVTLTGVDDLVDDGNQTGLVNVTIDAANSDDAFDVLAPQSVSITNVDDDTAGFTLSKTTATTVEDGTTDTFTVVLNAQPLSDVVITVSSNDPGETTADVASITFTSVNWNIPQTVTLTGIDDLVDDGDEMLLVTLAINDALSDNAFDAVANRTLSVKNTDNDTAGFTLSKVTATVSESATTDTFTVVLASRPLTNVVVLVSSADTGEVNVDVASLTFTSANWDTAQTVTLTGVADSSFDGDQSTLVTLRIDDLNSDNGFDNLSDQTVAVTTIDIDPPAQDYGDAPTAAQSGFTNDYPVTLNQDGARHTITSLFLGATVNGEADGQPSALANGDGNSDDGVSAVASQLTTSAASTKSSFRVIATEPGKLDAWIDFNQDGDWDDIGEQIFTSVDVQPGTNVLSYTIPAAAAVGSTAGRFRISSLGGLAPTGSANDGEVEDYINTLVDGDSAKGVTISVVNGSIVLKLDTSDNVISNGATELFRVLASSIASLNIIGTATDDTITIDFGSGFALPADGVTIAGAAGSNTLSVLGDGSLDLTDPNVVVTDVGSITLPATAVNGLTLNAAAIDRLAPTTKLLAITSGENATINLTDSTDWRMGTPTTVAGEFVLTAINSIGGQVIQVNSPLAWRNFIVPGDVNNSGGVTASDALAIIFELNQPQFSDPITGVLIDPLTANPFPGVYFDRNGDGRVSALDALIVINDLFQQQFGSGGGEGESEGESIITDFLRQQLLSTSSVAMQDRGSDTFGAVVSTLQRQDDTENSASSLVGSSPAMVELADDATRAVDELFSDEFELADWLLINRE